MTDRNADLAHGSQPFSRETPNVEEIDVQSTVDLALKNISLAESPGHDVSQASIQATDGYSDSGSHRLPELHLHSQPCPAGPMHYEYSQGQAEFHQTSQPTALQDHSGNLIYPSFGLPGSGYPRYPCDPRILPQYTSTEQFIPSFNCPYPPQYPQPGYVVYPMGSNSQPTPPFISGPTPYSSPNHMMHSQDNNTSQPTTMKANAPSKVGPIRVKEQRKHRCRVCDKFFLRPSSLRTHNTTHTGEKPYPCGFPGCHRGPQNGFSVLSNKTRHEKTIHQIWYQENAASLNQKRARKRNGHANCGSKVSGRSSPAL